MSIAPLSEGTVVAARSGPTTKTQLTSAEAQGLQTCVLVASDLVGISTAIAEMWVDPRTENKQHQGKRSKRLPVWALPKSRASAPQPNASGKPGPAAKDPPLAVAKVSS